MTRSTDIDNNLIVRAGRALGLAAALGLVLATGSVCAATFQAFSFPSDDQPGNQAYTGGLGNDFDVLSTIRVDSLGVFDDDGDGISGSLTVGIFDLSDVSSGPLVSATISGSDDLLVGSFRFNDVTPLILGPGNYSVVAFGFGADNNANENVADIPLVTNDGGGLIDFVNSRFGTGLPDYHHGRQLRVFRKPRGMLRRGYLHVFASSHTCCRLAIRLGAWYLRIPREAKARRIIKTNPASAGFFISAQPLFRISTDGAEPGGRAPAPFAPSVRVFLARRTGCRTNGGVDAGRFASGIYAWRYGQTSS